MESVKKKSTEAMRRFLCNKSLKSSSKISILLVKWRNKDKGEILTMSDKQLVLNIVKNIDDRTSYEEILNILYIQLEVQKGIKDMEEGKTKTSSEVKEIIDKK